LKKENSLPAYPYAPALTPRQSFRNRKLFRRAVVVFGFLAALLIAAFLRGV
jgi:hypothetical protein